jgi:hypothetical protein
MKYPLDQTTFNETVTHLVSHANMQTILIGKLLELVNGAMDASEHDDDDWYQEAETLIEDLQKLEMEHESRRWNEANYQSQVSAGAVKKPPVIPQARPRVVTHLAEQPIPVDPVIAGLQNIQFDIAMDQKANKAEEEFGGEMSEEDLARHFNQKREKKKKEELKKLHQMSLEEISEWERNQDNSNDIYKIKARIANLARGNNASLTKQGEQLVNTYVHVIKSFYDFADTIEDKTIKISLIKLIKANEGMPGNLIAAAGAGVTTK